MKLLDKFKNLFTEEVEEDVSIEIKDPTPKKEIPKEVVKKESAPIIPKEDPIKSENLSLKKEEKFVFPVYFDEKDFDDMEKQEKIKQPIQKHEEKKENVFKETYNKKQTDVKKNFKPSPIISPVYGVLDKNYYKEDIVVTSDTRSTYPSDRPINIDDVRKKAFGTLEDDLESELFSNDKGPKHASKEEKHDENIFDEFDFENAVLEDKKRDLTKDNLKSDIEALLNDKEFTNEFNFDEKPVTSETHLPKEEHVDELKEDKNPLTNDIDDDVLLGSDELPTNKEVQINDSNANGTLEDDILNSKLDMTNNISNNVDNEIDNAFADSSDLNDSDLFNLIDSMYSKGDE